MGMGIAMKIGRPRKIETAMIWLETILEDGPKTAWSIFEIGQKEFKFSKKTLRRAKKLLGIKSIQVYESENKRHLWIWSLPAE